MVPAKSRGKTAMHKTIVVACILLASLLSTVQASASVCGPRGKLDLDICEPPPRKDPPLFKPRIEQDPPRREVAPTIVHPHDRRGKELTGPGVEIRVPLPTFSKGVK
jgi:hypothetical protein